MSAERRWWATPGLPDNHNYVLTDGVQRCHLCGEVEPPLRHPTGDERTDRAAMHLVHGVRAHLTTTAREWRTERRPVDEHGQPHNIDNEEY